MTREEAIEILERKTTIPDTNYTWAQIDQAIDTAITALRSMQEAGEPLSLEQLQEMDGKPVWIEDKEYPENTGWVIWDDSFKQNWLGDPETQNSHGKSWLAYSYPSVHIDRGKWEACDHCKKACWNCNHNLLCCEGNDKECDDCVNQSKWEFLAYQNYCPKCGRPLTEEAWVELERRVMR